MTQTSHDLSWSGPDVAHIFDFDQAWLGAHQSGFAPASARLRRAPDGLLVWAELWDARIGTRATRDNQMLYELGDCFEIFLGQTETSPYIEIHIAPNGLTLQMNWDERGNAGEYDFERDVVTRGLLTRCETAIENASPSEIGRWFVEAEIGWPAFLRDEALANAQAGGPVSFLANFGRYDYGGDCPDEVPVLSATARHTASAGRGPNFHQRAVWHEVNLRQ